MPVIIEWLLWDQERGRGEHTLITIDMSVANCINYA